MLKKQNVVWTQNYCIGNTDILRSWGTLSVRPCAFVLTYQFIQLLVVAQTCCATFRLLIPFDVIQLSNVSECFLTIETKLLVGASRHGPFAAWWSVDRLTVS
jgi:hypothetical protein